MPTPRTTQPARRATRGFTLVELLVVMLIIAVLAGLLLPVLGSARRNAREMKSMTQTKNVHAAMVQYGNRNGGWYPGMNENGDAVNHQYLLSEKSNFSAAPEGNVTPAITYWLILKEGLIAADEVVSVSEASDITPYDVSDPQAFEPNRFTRVFRGGSGRAAAAPRHFSFATLDPNPSTSPAQANTTGKTIRKRNWRDNQNSQVVLVSDRATSVSGSDFESIHTLSAGKWRGAMAWGDNHATMEEDPVVSTRLTQDTPSNADHIFYGRYDKSVGSSTGPTDDAFMMWNYGSDLWFNLASQAYTVTND